MSRLISIWHRIKRTAEGEARPTTVLIVNPDGMTTSFELATDDDELDFVRGIFPLTWRKLSDDESVEGVPEYRIKWKKVKKGETYPENLVRKVDGDLMVADKVPETLGGLMAGDTVLMILGGMGDRFAYALSRSGERMNPPATVLRTSANIFRTARDAAEAEKPEAKEETNEAFLVRLYRSRPEAFYLTTVRDRKLIALREAFRLRQEALNLRMGCELRLRQLINGFVFCSEEGEYPEGGLDMEFRTKRDSSEVWKTLHTAEAEANRQLETAVKNFDVYQEFLSKVKGIGPAIASRIIVSVGDIRRFSHRDKLVAYLGVHVMNGGKHGDRPKDKQFPRRRHGEVANWHPDGRQALFLLMDQWNRRPDSVWGERFLAMKKKLREKHPEVVKDGTRLYFTDMWVHRTAGWRTVRRFVRELYSAWWALEEKAAGKNQQEKAA